jgi:hypothetical protein
MSAAPCRELFDRSNKKMSRTFNSKAVGIAIAIALTLASAALVQARRVPTHTPAEVGANSLSTDSSLLW